MTRAWTPKGAVARSRKNCDWAVNRLRMIALDWGDVDQYIVDEAEDLIREIEEFANDIETSVKDRLAAGEHIGL